MAARLIGSFRDELTSVNPDYAALKRVKAAQQCRTALLDNRESVFVRLLSPEYVRALFGKILQPTEHEGVSQGFLFGFAFSNRFTPVKTDPTGSEVACA